MRRFIKRLVWFSTPLLLFIVAGLLLPATPRAKKSLLFGSLQKDSLLQHIEGPRIIFVGGSNLSFGLNSQIIRDSVWLNPINTAVHVEIGLRYMLNNTSRFIKKGDLVVLAPEYTIFHRDCDDVSVELLRTILDVNPRNIELLSSKQMVNFLSGIPKYAFSKFKPDQYYGVSVNDVYAKDSFNQYGDAHAHWHKKGTDFRPMNGFSSKLNEEVISSINEFQTEIQKKGGVLLITFPALQDISFMNSAEQIKQIDRRLREKNFTLLGTPERYMIPNSMMFDTPYHLNKTGVDYRTLLLLADLRNYDAKLFRKNEDMILVKNSAED